MKKFRTITVKEENGVERVALVEAESESTGTGTDVACTITISAKIPQELFFLYGTDEVSIDMPLTQETLERAKLYYEFFKNDLFTGKKGAMQAIYKNGEREIKFIHPTHRILKKYARMATINKLMMEGRAMVDAV